MAKTKQTFQERANMKVFSRGVSGDCFKVIRDENDSYRVAVYDSLRLLTHGEDAKPYYIHEGRFDTESIAEVVCKMLSEEYNEGVSDGQVGCY